MDVTVIKSFLADRLATRNAVEEAAAAVNVSVATMYRYKANPEAIDLGVLKRLSDHLGLPLQNGVAWLKTNVIGSERRRLELEKALSVAGGARFTTMPHYTVNEELPEITRLILQFDYGTRAPQLEREVLPIRAERSHLYSLDAYVSWEVWNVYGYLDFFHGRGRFKDIPKELRVAQIAKFVESSKRPGRHRFMSNSPELPMFGVYSPPGVALVRIDDIHFEFQAPALISSFEETFNEILDHSFTKTADQFIAFLENPSQ